jgi:ArsR family transcriptional regulator, arsenate/arsenite/antimonite-responsive transcriptional repressor
MACSQSPRIEIDDCRYLGRDIDGCQYVWQTGGVNLDCCPPLGSGLDETEADELASAFKALADPARLRLLSLIAAQPGGACTCNLVEPLGKSQPTISHHLKILRAAGLVESERIGSWVWYRIVPDRLEALRGVLVSEVESNPVELLATT